MLGENNNLKDSELKSLSSFEASSTNLVSINLTYTKTTKLITALFMVTDIMDREEPLRHKLRFLGTNVISDINNNPTDSSKKISEILSFLDIGFAVGMISEMNLSILKKEFTELQKSINVFSTKRSPIWLEEFMKDTSVDETILTNNEHQNISKKEQKVTSIHHIGHPQSTRIGVQKGGNLMKVLSDRVSHMSGVKHTQPSPIVSVPNHSYDLLKTKRRGEIISIIKNKLSVLPNSGGATITDIKNSAEGPLVSCGEKTLQRELVSMVHDGILIKTGEKRWSKYSIKNVR
jgi:hypothetical protein